MRLRVDFIISGLGGGGAERMLLKLLSKIDRDVFAPNVISLTHHGEITAQLVNQFGAVGIPVYFLGMQGGIPDPRGLGRLLRIFRQTRPQLIQTWMYHADLIGGVAGRYFGNIPVIWNIRHSCLDKEADKKRTIWTAKLCSRLSSYLPRKIICCSTVSQKFHSDFGYDSSKIVVIPNGFDVEDFKPRYISRSEICKELGIPQDNLIIGYISRFHPIKDHRVFIKAAKLLVDNNQKTKFVLCGNGISWDNLELASHIEKLNLRQHFYLLGHRTDIPRITASFDIASSSSSGEGFPNIIGEAMACGVPCAVTDVGDSAHIVGDTGKIVPPRDPEALFGAWSKLIEMGDEKRKCLGVMARKRVLEKFDLAEITKQYEKTYKTIAATENMDKKLSC